MEIHDAHFLLDLSIARLDGAQSAHSCFRYWLRQYKLSKGGEIIRTDVQVGDDTRPRFIVSLWQKQMGSLAISGDVILLQSKITSQSFYLNVVEQ